MLDHYGTSHTCSNDSCGHISPVRLVNKGFVEIILCGELFGHFIHLEILAHECHKVIHFITPVDIHDLADGSQAVGGVVVAVAVNVREAAPEAFADIGQQVVAQVVDVRRFAVQQLGELELANIEQFYDQPKVVRVVGERGNASFVELNAEGPDGEIVNSITANHADFVVSEQDFRSSLREAMFESMFDLVGRLSQVNPQVALNLLDLVVEMVDVPNRDELVSRIRKLNGQRDPDAEPTPEEVAEQQQAAQQAAIQQQIQYETLMNTLRKLKAEGSKLDAETVQKHVDSMLAALEGAQIVAAAPATAPIADEIMRSAGFKDATPEETLPQGTQPPAMPPAQPMQAPPMADGLAATEGV